MYECDITYQRIEVYKYTSDNWCPSFELDNPYGKGELLVRVSTMPLMTDGDDRYRVCVWGEDDMGMERDFPDSVDAADMFNRVLRLKDVTMSSLESLGFVSA